jgi:ferredoxin
LVTTEQEESFLSYSFELIVEEVDKSEDHILKTSVPTSPPTKVSKFRGPDFSEDFKNSIPSQKGQNKCTFEGYICIQNRPDSKIPGKLCWKCERCWRGCPGRLIYDPSGEFRHGRNPHSHEPTVVQAEAYIWRYSAEIQIAQLVPLRTILSGLAALSKEAVHCAPTSVNMRKYLVYKKSKLGDQRSLPRSISFDVPEEYKRTTYATQKPF